MQVAATVAVDVERRERRVTGPEGRRLDRQEAPAIGLQVERERPLRRQQREVVAAVAVEVDEYRVERVQLAEAGELRHIAEATRAVLCREREPPVYVESERVEAPIAVPVVPQPARSAQMRRGDRRGLGGREGREGAEDRE